MGARIDQSCADSDGRSGEGIAPRRACGYGKRYDEPTLVCVGWANRGSLVRFSPLEIPRAFFTLCVVFCSVWALFICSGPFLSTGICH